MVFVQGGYSLPDDAEYPVHPHIIAIRAYHELSWPRWRGPEFEPIGFGQTAQAVDLLD
jgi:hypothetical protein